MPESSPVESVDRALRLLTMLARAGASGVSLADLALGLGLNKTTTHRNLAALRFRDFVAQDPVTGSYLLGSSAVRLAEAHYGNENLPVLLHPALVALCAEVDELVHLGVLSGSQMVYLDKVEPERAVRVWSTVGGRRPAVSTALGRVLLAFRGVDQRALDGYVRAVSPAAVDADHIWAAVKRARREGFATEAEENEPGIGCVAVPLLRSGTAIAAVSITAPIERISPERAMRLHHQMGEVLPPLLPGGLTLP